ncbi:MAG: hypothetical protein MZV70_00220 [Desulfobacterales bacterium]|nr:hypothetical protein [Desulfobacterales bacterium]
MEHVKQGWPRRRTIRLPAAAYRTGDPFHVVIRAAAGVVPFESPSRVRVMTSLLDPQLRTATAGLVQAYCVMPDHLHVLLVGVPDVVAWVCDFKARVTTALRRQAWSGQVWQRSFYDRCLRGLSGEELERAERYIVENPVRRGLVARVEAWPHWRVAGGGCGDPRAGGLGPAGLALPYVVGNPPPQALPEPAGHASRAGGLGPAGLALPCERLEPSRTSRAARPTPRARTGVGWRS